MSLIPGLFDRLKALLRRDQLDRDTADEIQHHLAMEAAQNRELGMRTTDAERKARLDFGSIEAIREAERDARGSRWVHDFLGDVRYSVRSLRRSPVLAGAAILTLALGIGANTAIFSAVNAVILRPLPFADPGRLYMVWEQNPEKGWYKNIAAPANYLDWKEQVAAFKDVGAWADWQSSVTLVGEGRPIRLKSGLVTGNMFSVLGVDPLVGRSFTWEETWKTGTPVTVLSERLWRTHFNADPAIVGKTLDLDGVATQVVGVMPKAAGAFPREGMDLWAPMGWDPESRSKVGFRRAHWLRVAARLQPGVSATEADAQLQTTVKLLQQDYPATNRVMGAGMTPLHEFLIGDTRGPLLLLLASVGVLLLIACGNVGNLLLVRAAGMEREVALRLALGAGRNRVVRQALTESLVLSVLGAVVGLVVGWAGIRVLVLLEPPKLLPTGNVTLSWPVLGYILLITLACAALFGAAPAAWGARRAPVDALKEGGKSGSGSHRVRRWSDLLVVGEVALALLLTIGACLVLRSYWRLNSVDPGFDGDGVLSTLVVLPGSRYDGQAKVTAFFEDLVTQARSLPGVISASGTTSQPLTGVRWTSDFTAQGWAPDQVGFEVGHREVMPDYYRMLGVPLVKGRAFTDADRAGAPKVVIINQTLATRYFPNEDPIGKLITFDKVPDSTSIWRTIVGVAQDGGSGLYLLLKTRGNPAALGPSVRDLVERLDPTLAIVSTTTLSEERGRSLARQRFMLTLMGAFSVTGMLLAVIGVYGVMAQLARGRVREMGIRIALGAQAGSVQWLVVRHGLRLVGAGLVLGLAGAVVLSRSISALLFQVEPLDPVTFVTVPLLLVVSGLAACWLPAFRVSRASPALALRT
ncbi:MAG TPA: ABC transporter permease, partial [Gemmatimonadales bacterium]|nr:ABC transporter permease [Gemmatimonadales bacterium]